MYISGRKQLPARPQIYVGRHRMPPTEHPAWHVWALLAFAVGLFWAGVLLIALA